MIEIISKYEVSLLLSSAVIFVFVNNIDNKQMHVMI